MNKDAYAASAAAYDLYIASARAGQLAALQVFLPTIRTDHGPVLDIGAGSGLNTVTILEHLPQARVCALEPSPAMRALALAKIAAHPEWFDRVTVRPEGFFDAPLPASIGGAVLLGVLGHFEASDRPRLFSELASRLPSGGAVLIDLQPPQRPERVEPYEFTVATIGDLSYHGIAEGWPLDEERMRWRMTYQTIDNGQVLDEESADHIFRHPAPEHIHTETSQAGLELKPVEDIYYLAVKH